MFDSVLLPTDGSETASTAANGAVDLADRFDATLHVIHVVDLPDLPAGVNDTVSDELQKEAQEYLQPVTSAATGRGITVIDSVIESDSPVHEAIVEYVTDHEINCVVMGTTGKTGLRRVALGSVAERTLRTCPVPVITVSEGAALDVDFPSIVVPTDGSEGSTKAGDLAIDLLAGTDGSLHVIHAVDIAAVGVGDGGAAVYEALEDVGQSAIDDLIERAQAADIRQVESTILSGDAASSIVQYADERDVSCIVLGTQGRTGVGRLLLGSVAELVVRRASVPVITVNVKQRKATEADIEE